MVFKKVQNKAFRMVVSSGGVERKLGQFMLYQGMQQYE